MIKPIADSDIKRPLFCYFPDMALQKLGYVTNFEEALSLYRLIGEVDEKREIVIIRNPGAFVIHTGNFFYSKG